MVLRLSKTVTPPTANATQGAGLRPPRIRASATRARRPRRLRVTARGPVAASVARDTAFHRFQPQCPHPQRGHDDVATARVLAQVGREDTCRAVSECRAGPYSVRRSASANGQHLPCRRTAVWGCRHLLSHQGPPSTPSPVPRAGHHEERPRATRALPGHGHLGQGASPRDVGLAELVCHSRSWERPC